MEQRKVSLYGTILCKHCNDCIGEVDTSRVSVFYMSCKKEECLQKDAEQYKAAK
ncbi:GapA-binding peptide SR1P [Paenibacillus sp. FSL W7-1287]|uniref:GapA-binding peptide SR1P n=1 Tax=Paenibacillus sp. FSL W7-1287 TaxID=2954538 RepID=UPI00255A16D0|nr:GapA-binding peptide SR1P [Paenibacillus camelliae]